MVAALRHHPAGIAIGRTRRVRRHGDTFQLWPLRQSAGIRSAVCRRQLRRGRCLRSGDWWRLRHCATRAHRALQLQVLPIHGGSEGARCAGKRQPGSGAGVPVPGTAVIAVRQRSWRLRCAYALCRRRRRLSHHGRWGRGVPARALGVHGICSGRSCTALQGPPAAFDPGRHPAEAKAAHGGGPGPSGGCSSRE